MFPQETLDAPSLTLPPPSSSWGRPSLVLVYLGSYLAFSKICPAMSTPSLSTVSVPCLAFLYVLPFPPISRSTFPPSHFYPSFLSMSECWESNPGFHTRDVNNVPVSQSFSPAGCFHTCLTPCLVLFHPRQDLWTSLSLCSSSSCLFFFSLSSCTSVVPHPSCGPKSSGFSVIRLTR